MRDQLSDRRAVGEDADIAAKSVSAAPHFPLDCLDTGEDRSSMFEEMGSMVGG